KADPALDEIGRLETRDPTSAASAYARLAAQASDANLAAIALQGQVRCLLRTGESRAAIAVLGKFLSDDRYHQSVDAQGRLIQPNAALMLLELLQDSVPGQSRAIRAQLQARLMEYDDAAMTSPQRRFLMRELQKLAPEIPA